MQKMTKLVTLSIGIIFVCKENQAELCDKKLTKLYRTETLKSYDYEKQATNYEVPVTNFCLGKITALC